MLTVGLTGGVASGKTLVSRMLGEFGARVIDTDTIAREVVEPGQPALAAIVAAFGESVLDAAGRLDRRSMRRRVFADADSRRQLESIVHPQIRARTLERMAAAAQNSSSYLVVVVPLLVETDFARHVDRVLVVDCPVDIQISRLMQRDDMTQVQAQAMVDAQADPVVRRSAADDIIDNGGPVVWTRAQAWRVHLRYMRA